MLSKAQNKYIRSLTHQKYRKEYKVFIAEGEKVAAEWLGSNIAIQQIIAVSDWAAQNQRPIQAHPEATLHVVTPQELGELSLLQTPNNVMLVIPEPEPQTPGAINEWCLALDGIQDPGNMGTIIRIADWFGIQHVVAAPGSADFYNPKVVQAAMGSHLRVNLYKTELAVFLAQATLPVLAAALDGENIYTIAKPKTAIIVIGNESKGISDAVMQLSTKKIKIPQKGGAESLNAGVSAGIICALLAGS